MISEEEMRRIAKLVAEELGEEIAERAAKKALEKVYMEVGKSVIRKVLWIIGLVALTMLLTFNGNIKPTDLLE